MIKQYRLKMLASAWSCTTLFATLELMINAVIFDIGHVLFAYNPVKVIQKLSPQTPYENEYLAVLFDNPLWYQLDRGDYSQEKALEIVSQHVNHHPEKVKDLHRFLTDFAFHLDVIEETKSYFLYLTQHPDYKVYILSNFQDKPFDVLLNTHPFLNKADGIVVSAKVKMAKPDPRIYDYILSTYNLTANKTLFIDDLAENISSAKDCGLHGIVYSSPDQLRNALLPYDIVVPETT